MSAFEKEVEKLINDDSFISYFLRKDEQDIVYWETILLTQPDKKPVVAEALNRLTQMNKALKDVERQRAVDRLRKAVEMQKSELPVIETVWQKISWHQKYGRRLAAAVMTGLLVVSALYFYRPSEKSPSLSKMTTKEGERKSFLLPDGSQVILNGGSQLEIMAGFNDNTREVQLKGEAYFDVTKNSKRPFIIHTSTMHVRVLGTAFNVKAYEDEALDETSLIRGEVEITLTREASGKTYLLKPLQKLVVNKELVARIIHTQNDLPDSDQEMVKLDSLRQSRLIDGLTETAWTENRLVFENETLSDAARKIEKWYGVEVEFKNQSLQHLRYTGTFDKQNIEKVLEVIHLTIPVLHYRFEGSGKVIFY
ncbi:MAG TPA: FecR domain-containing protein [Parasegetibacter sp.]